jgi:TetR/AcrR family transcriptional regulator, transcriptional repressor for nem operon
MAMTQPAPGRGGVGEVSTKRRGPGSKADEWHPTRAAIVEATMRILERESVAGASVATIVNEAQIARGTFYIHFPDRDAVLTAIHDRFHQELFDRIAGESANEPPGVRRVTKRLGLFLDGCIQMQATRALLVDARYDPSLTAMSARRSRQAAEVLAEDLPKHDVTGARLLVAATTEASLAELEAGHQLPDIRSALFAMARSLAQPTTRSKPPI